jgi:hypothetical protein
VTRRGMLEQFAQSVEPGVVVVEPRVLRRIIRLDGRVQGFPQLLSRRETYPIERNRLLALVDPGDLGVTSPGSLPDRLVLLAKSDDLDSDEESNAESFVQCLTRPLFHACVHLELEKHFAHEPASDRVAAERRRQLGETEFAEFHSVLLQDDRLFHASSDVEVYVEFVAWYLEMWYFAPEALSCHFPGVRDWQLVDDIVRQDIDHQALFARLPVRGWADALVRGRDESAAAVRPEASDGSITLAEFRHLQMQAERAAATGNHVKAALLHAKASVRGPQEYCDEAHAAACAELAKLAWRLRGALNLADEQVEDWAHSLQGLLVAPGNRFSWVEARLLYDLQKACVEHERRVHRTSIWQWILTRGKRSCDRPLPLLGNTLTLRHLHRAHRRVSATRMDVACRQHVTALLESALTLVESRTRHRLRRIMNNVFEEIGLQPENVPEHVARAKMIEELIDRILERGYLSMADLRDALSKNDLKLPDVAGLENFMRGDRLLKADRALSDALEGVYRRGAVYQRWPQMLSSLAFGTRTGRFLTQFVAVPYGGAFLALECLRHLGHFPTSGNSSAKSLLQHTSTLPAGGASTDWTFVAAVLCLGTWISLLVHRPSFLQWNLSLLRLCGRHARKWLIDFPAGVVHSKFVQQILASYAFCVVQDYVLRPVLVTAFLSILARVLGFQWSNRVLLELTLLAALFLNSALGRFVAEVTTHYLMRLWRDLRIRVIGSLAQWTMDVFRGLVTTLERMINLIDEWLRLRRGSSRVIRICKILGGILWFIIAYVVIFVFTLLVEPQINPIKHFPVVTVSHKLILPAGPAIVKQLSSVLGVPLANTLVWTTIWLIPGVCGFLVWELKENWRLYRANRPRNIRAESIGSHGETMLRLLRPGFHSGTLPKAFSALRRAIQRGESSDGKRFRRRWTTIRRVEVDVQRFVERELLSLLAENKFLAGAVIGVRAVRSSTNRIDVDLTCARWPEQSALLTWEYVSGRLVGSVSPQGWVNHLEANDRATLAAAVSGLFQRAGVEEVGGPLPLTVEPPFTWANWVHMWQRDGAGIME